MAKVVSVEARTVHIPLRQATAFARRQVTSRDYSLVKIRTDDGVEGIGHCYAGHSGGNVVTTAVREMLAPMLIGADPYATELHWKNMYQEVLLHGRVGSVMRGLSILDTALWDRNARAANLPLYKYLGAAYEGIGLDVIGGFLVFCLHELGRKGHNLVFAQFDFAARGH